MVVGSWWTIIGLPTGLCCVLARLLSYVRPGTDQVNGPHQGDGKYFKTPEISQYHQQGPDLNCEVI